MEWELKDAILFVRYRSNIAIYKVAISKNILRGIVAINENKL